MMRISSIKWLSLFLLTIWLSACGGGGGGTQPVAVNPALTTSPLSSPASTTSGIRNNGVLNFDVILPVSTKALGSGTVTFSSPTGTLTFLANSNFIGFQGFTATTSNLWAGFSYFPTVGGVLGLDGNANLNCTSFAAASGRLLLSSNLTPVATLDELKGKTFRSYYCESLNSPASLLAIDSVGNVTAGTNTVSASDFVALFSSLGVGFGTQDWTRLRAYKQLINGVLTYVIIDEGNDSTGYYVGIHVQQ